MSVPIIIKLLLLYCLNDYTHHNEKVGITFSMVWRFISLQSWVQHFSKKIHVRHFEPCIRRRSLSRDDCDNYLAPVVIFNKQWHTTCCLVHGELPSYSRVKSTPCDFRSVFSNTASLYRIVCQRRNRAPAFRNSSTHFNSIAASVFYIARAVTFTVILNVDDPDGNNWHRYFIRLLQINGFHS